LVGAGEVKHAAFLLFLALAACSGAQTPLDPAGDQASQLFSLFTLMLWVCGIAYALTLAFLGWSIWRARHVIDRAAPDADPDDRRIALGLRAWIGLVTVGLIVLTAGSFLVDWALSRAERTAALEVRITGHQWWWRIEYRDPASGAWIETANELHLPQGFTTRVTLGSADVIHSFWVPNVSGKMDVVPGRVNQLALTPRRLGWFRGQCAEFCGPQHAHMAFDVYVEPPAQFAAWLANQRQPAPAQSDAILARGMRLVTEGSCAACHRLRGTPAAGRAGPDLTHLASRRAIAAGTLPMTRGAIQGWIAQPKAIKSGTMMPAIPLSAADADAVSRYLVTLK
jgi:cytochrome c oxidase subunit 2